MGRKVFFYKNTHATGPGGALRIAGGNG